MIDPTTPEAPPTPASDLIMIGDIDQFAKLIAAWHASKMDLCKHLLQVPSGTVFKLGDKDLVLSDDALAAFKFGIEMCLMQVSELPFEEQPAAPAPEVPIPG